MTMPPDDRARDRARSLSRTTLALVAGAWLVSGSAAHGFQGPPNYPAEPRAKARAGGKAKPLQNPKTCGTLGYGPPGPQPGFQGFGLRYGLNYGYGGGKALGVGAEGGYPFYGGPGYPHPAPTLNRLSGITAFPYFGGPGGPTPTCPNYYAETGPLVPDQPVVQFEAGPNDADPATAYGAFTGVLNYPERTFAPFSSVSGESTQDSVSDSVVDPDAPPPPAPNGPGEVPPPPPTSSPAPPPPPPPVNPLAPASNPSAANPIGLETVPVADGTMRGLRVTRVSPGLPADRSGLVAGDVIRSANGFVTERPGNLDWIIANAASRDLIQFTVKAARDGQIRAVTTQLR